MEVVTATTVRRESPSPLASRVLPGAGGGAGQDHEQNAPTVSPLGCGSGDSRANPGSSPLHRAQTCPHRGAPDLKAAPSLGGSKDAEKATPTHRSAQKRLEVLMSPEETLGGG